jgi:hypothetical protein
MLRSVPEIVVHAHSLETARLHRNVIVVIRNPEDRFRSAFQHSFNQAPRCAHRGKADLLGYSWITTPNSVAEAAATGDLIAYDYLDQILFEPQSSWYHDPMYPLLFDEMNETFPALVKELTGRTVTLPYVNKSNRPETEEPFSKLALSFLHKKYKLDYEIYKELLNGY